jgi:hypothetical protein
MIQEWNNLEKLIFDANGGNLVNIEEDKECRDYLGYNFQLGNQQLKFRKAKVTPKKIGQFVTLWKRNLIGETVPFDIADGSDCYIIVTSIAYRTGIFVFPKAILAKMGILSSDDSTGKRGFRIYPEWDTPTSSQGLKTKKWQEEYFIDMDKEQEAKERLQVIFHQAVLP